MKKIAIFNHKGGVSKTTTAFNLGWMLARMNKKVILVDADSQCNLSLFAMGYEKFEAFYSSGNENNIKDALAPAFKSKPQLLDKVNCEFVKRNENLLLLPGHLDLTEYEVSLGVSFNLSGSFGVMKNLPGAINYMINKTAMFYKADYILIDMNPSLSAINQDILVSSDYFIVPTSPDIFSLMAIKSLSRVIPAWEKWAKQARDIFSDAEYPLPTTTPKFIGYTINDFNLTSGMPNKSFADIMDKISMSIKTDLVPKLSQEGMLLDNSLYVKSNELQKKLKKQRDTDIYCLAEISNFNKLIALSNSISIPIYELSADRLPYAGQVRTLNWFKRLFEVIAKKVIILTNG